MSLCDDGALPSGVPRLEWFEADSYPNVVAMMCLLIFGLVAWVFCGMSRFWDEHVHLGGTFAGDQDRMAIFFAQAGSGYEVYSEAEWLIL